MEPEKCRFCGAVLSEKAKFCFECGTLIVRAKQEEEKPKSNPSENETLSGMKPDKTANNEISDDKAINSEKNVDSKIKDDAVPERDKEQNENRQIHQHHQEESSYRQNGRSAASGEQFNPYTTPPPSDSKYASVGVWSYVGMMVLFSLPVIGFILAIIWAFDARNINRRNYARAILVLTAIIFLLSTVITVVGIVLLYDVIKEIMESFPQNGYTFPFKQYDIRIDGLIEGMKSENGAFIYRHIGDMTEL